MNLKSLGLRLDVNGFIRGVPGFKQKPLRAAEKRALNRALRHFAKAIGRAWIAKEKTNG